MKHKLIYPKFNPNTANTDIKEIYLSELKNSLELKDLKSKNILIDDGVDYKDNTKYIRIGSAKFGFGDGETHHYLIDNEWDISYFKTGFEESQKTVREEFDYLSSEEKMKMYFDLFIISYEIFCDEENNKIIKELENDNNEIMFPVNYNGKSYSKEECDEMFLAYYPCVEALNCEGGVYVADDTWVYPDGTLNEF